MIIPLAWGLFMGFKKGLIIELASFIALIAGIYIAVHFSFLTSSVLSGYIDISPGMLPIVSFIITFILVVLGVHLIGKIVEKLIKLVALGFFNRLGGAAFSMLKYAIFLSVLILLMNKFMPSLVSEKDKEDSYLYEPIEEIAPFLWEKLDKLDMKKVKDYIPSSDTTHVI
jgi:membrane protein required for colicin V production